MFRTIVMGFAAGALAGSACLAAVPSWAADPPPARNANIWDGIPHEPSATAVHRQEKASGVALPASQQNKMNREVEQLSRKLLNEQNGIGQGGGAAVGAGSSTTR